MNRVVMDTNVLISALLSPDGMPAKVLDLILNRELQLCYDSRILAEYELVMARPKFKFDPDAARALLNALARMGLSVIPVPSTAPMPDESDRKFYDVAKSCDAVLVTGNLRHFPAEPFVMTPAGLVEAWSKE